MAIIDCAEKVRNIDETKQSLRRIGMEITDRINLLDNTNVVIIDHTLDSIISECTDMDMNSRTDTFTTTGNPLDFEWGRSSQPEKTKHYTEMADHKGQEINLLLQEDFGTFSGRQCGAVPGAAPSSSSEGQTCVLSAGMQVEHIIADNFDKDSTHADPSSDPLGRGSSQAEYMNVSSTGDFVVDGMGESIPPPSPRSSVFIK